MQTAALAILLQLFLHQQQLHQVQAAVTEVITEVALRQTLVLAVQAVVAHNGITTEQTAAVRP
jgi:uncharacterized membrane protein